MHNTRDNTFRRREVSRMRVSRVSFHNLTMDYIVKASSRVKYMGAGRRESGDNGHSLEYTGCHLHSVQIMEAGNGNCIARSMHR